MKCNTCARTTHQIGECPEAIYLVALKGGKSVLGVCEKHLTIWQTLWASELEWVKIENSFEKS